MSARGQNGVDPNEQPATRGATALAKVEPATLARVVGLEVGDIVARVEKIRSVAAEVMREDHHFGKIPGVDKPTLLKPGAELLCLTFQLAPSFKFQEKRSGDHLEVIATCTLTHIPTGAVLGSAVGSCSSRESKYAYRKAARTCPECGKATIIKGREEYGGGWLCWKKPDRGSDGCGAKFADGDTSIESQQTGRVDNPDLPDTHNTVRKMASKRALVAIVLIVTCASDLYTQDVEEQGREEAAEPAKKPPASGGAKSKPQAVPSAKDVADVLAMIGECKSTAELDAVKRANNKRPWARSQVKDLNEADAKRRTELTTPDNDANEAYAGAS
ncbi:MAG TPA: hypothetical protein VFV10_15845 [Gammaproteobacteria bacterium]|nr:hypothetical protein [Gammaproteobacteria bacterium]